MIDLARLAKDKVLPAKPWGILYRPALTHRLIVLKRDDPKSRDDWKVHQILSVRMPNAAPAFEVRIERNTFVKRTTSLDFESGVLTTMKIIKDNSELNELVTLPITIAQIAVTIPTDILKFQLAETNARKNLITSQQAYINSLIALQAIQAKDGDGDGTPGGTPAPGARLGDETAFVVESCKGEFGTDTTEVEGCVGRTFMCTKTDSGASLENCLRTAGIQE